MVMCNPPFYRSEGEARRVNSKKVRNLAKNKKARSSLDTASGREVSAPPPPSPVAAAAVAATATATATSTTTGSNNFSGSDSELWWPGGEVGFISRLVHESTAYHTQCMWFTSLVSNKDSLPPLERLLGDFGRAVQEVHSHSHTHTYTLTLTHLHTHTHTHTLTHSHSHSHTR